MNRAAKTWKEYWEKQTLPLHKTDDDDYYVPYCNELRLLYDGLRPERILEIGCGNGALYQHLGFDRAAEYKGVDYSESMLAQFHRRYPSATLINASGHDYEDDGKYDLIFSNGVLQYFDPAMLAEHVERAARMLTPTGRFVCASVPWRRLRAKYATGRFFNLQSGILLRWLRYVRFHLRDTMGRWFEWDEFEDLGRKNGLIVKFYGSLNYPYRFHAVYHRPDAIQATIAA
jgi:cyclopropane fatty-acyl-phospholipid synthase-like methyltransferase